MQSMFSNSRFVIAGALALASTFATAANLCAERDVPEGARVLGLTRKVINLCPKVADIAPDDAPGKFKLWDGHWWDNNRSPRSTYSDGPDGLVMKPGGGLTSISPKDSSGTLPKLRGSHAFYVEFSTYQSGNDPDHWPAVWLLPIEHNGKQDDRYPGDPDGFERWMELDVDEGGFTPGMLGTVHSWTGVYPDYKTERNPYQELGPKLDRTVPHTFAASYDPKTLKVVWYLDGKVFNEATAPFVPEVARKQNYYILLNNQTHGKNVPYEMTVRRVRAFVAP